MTYLSLPVSTSQSVVGAILGIGIALQQTIHWGGLRKVVLCWIGTPIGAMIIAFLLYKFSQYIFSKIKMDILSHSTLIQYGLLISGAYGAFALGANNVANVTGVFISKNLCPQAFCYF